MVYVHHVSLADSSQAPQARPGRGFQPVLGHRPVRNPIRQRRRLRQPLPLLLLQQCQYQFIPNSTLCHGSCCRGVKRAKPTPSYTLRLEPHALHTETSKPNPLLEGARERERTLSHKKGAPKASNRLLWELSTTRRSLGV